MRLAANYAIDRRALSEAETLGASKVVGSIVPRNFEFALPIEPYPYDPGKAKQLLAEAGYPNGFDAGELHQLPPYFSMGETIIGYLGAVGVRLKMRPMERAAYTSALLAKKLRGSASRDRDLRQRRVAHVGACPEHGRLRLWGLSRHRRAVQGAGPRDRPPQARGDAAPDPAAGP